MQYVEKYGAKRAGSVCLNSILGLVSGGSAGFKLPR
jgi:hypothetical protein